MELTIRVRYNRAADLLEAHAYGHPSGGAPVASVSLAGLRRLTQRLARRIVRRLIARRPAEARDEVGFFPFVKKAWAKAWNTAKKVAKAVGVAKAVNAVKRAASAVVKKAGQILKDPRLAAAIGITAAVVPGVGPAIAAGYAGVRAAMAIADGAARGDPQALAAVGKYAAQNTEGGQKALALIQTVAPQVQTAAAQVADNPWLRGLAAIS